MDAVTSAPPHVPRHKAAMATENKLLVSAKKVFIREGYEGATIRTIADDSGFTTGAIFNHFPSGKEELFASILNADRQKYADEMHIAAKAEGDVLEVLTNFFAVDYRHQDEQQQLVRDKLALWWRGEKYTTQHMLGFQQETILRVEGILSRAVVRRELDPVRTPCDTLSEMFWDIYLAEYQYTSLREPRLAAMGRCNSFKTRARIMLAGYQNAHSKS